MLLFRDYLLEFRIQDLGFRFEGVGLLGFGCRVPDVGCSHMCCDHWRPSS